MANSKLMSKKNKMIKLKLVMEKLQSSLSLGRRLSMSDVDEIQAEHDHDNNNDHQHGVCYEDTATTVPRDVKEGHFAVVAVDGGVAKRFVVPLRYLTHPMFLALLEKAAEEYGFEHGGALTIPCRASEIENILGERWDGGRQSSRRSNKRANAWTKRSFDSNFMLQSY